MSKKDGSKHRARYTLEIKLKAVRLVKGGHEASVTARALGVPKQTLSDWIRLAGEGQLQGAGEDGARHLKKATAYFARKSL